MSDFKVLDDRTHIASRPSMYIGSVAEELVSGIIDYKYQTKKVVPGLIKIISEILDNSVDEFIRTNGQFANKISVSITNTVSGPKITISDNGRGIPVEKVDDSYRPVLAWTRARAGSNFNDDSNRITMGMNGVGSFATTVFSTEFVGTTCDGTSKIVVTCTDNCKNVDYVLSKGKDRGTTVSFIPDLEKFNLKEFTEDHIILIKDRLQNLAVCYPTIQFKLNDEKIQFKNLKSIAENFSEHSVTFQAYNGMYIITSSGKDEEFRCLSYVNGLNIKNAGSHVDYMMECIINNIRPAIKRKWKIEVLPNQIRQHLLIASWISGFTNLKFDSQSKERITNSRAEVLQNIGYFEAEAETIAKKIINTEAIITPMIEAILHKQELDDRRKAAAALKKVQKKRIANHLTASGTDWKTKSIFLAEGLCLHEDTEVFTIDRNKRIADIEIGDLIFTHKNRFRPVIGKAYALKTGIKINGVIYSPNHRLYVYDVLNNEFDFIMAININISKHKLIKNRLIEAGMFNNIHEIINISKSNTVTTSSGFKIKFSDTHEIFNLDGYEVTSKTIKQLHVGDLILI